MLELPLEEEELEEEEEEILFDFEECEDEEIEELDYVGDIHNFDDYADCYDEAAVLDENTRCELEAWREFAIKFEV